MKNTRRKYSAEFKEQAVKRLLNEVISQSALARELGIDPSLLGNWRDQYQEKQGWAMGAQEKSEKAELERLRRENLRQKQELEILKKASAYFARHVK